MITTPSSMFGEEPFLKDRIPSEEIEKSIERIKERGWCQREMEDTDGRYCILGSMDSVYGRQDIKTLNYITDAIDSEYSVRRVCSCLDHYDYDGCSHRVVIINFNDKHGRTKDEVLDMLTLAAKNARNEGN